MKQLDKNVKNIIEQYPKKIQKIFYQIRSLIFECAQRENIGDLNETIKWGEPAYLPQKANVGTTIRFAWQSHKPHKVFLLVNCRTTLILAIKNKFGELFEYEGNRAIVIDTKEPLKIDELMLVFAMVLKYHMRKKAH